MKFGETLKFNAVPDWLPHYMAYDACKKKLEHMRRLQARIFHAQQDIGAPPGPAPPPLMLSAPQLPPVAVQQNHDDSSDEDEHAAEVAAAAASRRTREGAGHTEGAPHMARTASQAVLEVLDRDARALDAQLGKSSAMMGGSFQAQVPSQMAQVHAQASLQRPVMSPSSPMGPMSPTLYAPEEGLSISEYSARLAVADQEFFEKLDEEAVKVDTFYREMMEKVPQYWTMCEERVLELLDIQREYNITGGSATVRRGPRNEDDDTDVEYGEPDPDVFTPLVGSNLAVHSPTGGRSTARRGSNVQPDVALPARPPRAAGRRRIPVKQRGETNVHESCENELKKWRKRLCAQYVDIVGMTKFSSLNEEAFDKILKKHDKILGCSTRAMFMDALKLTRTFTDADRFEQLAVSVERFYAGVWWDGNLEDAKQELLEGVREQIIWSRSTVWGEMLREQKKTQSFVDAKSVDFSSPAKRGPIILAAVAFFVILQTPGFVDSLVVNEDGYPPIVRLAATRCLALVAAVIILWSQDGLPPYVAGFLVMPTIVVSKILLTSSETKEAKDVYEFMSRHDSARQVFKDMSSGTLIVIVCVYSLGAALSKYSIDKKLASELLSRIHRPQTLLLAVMVMAVPISMLVSNVASPVLLNSIVLPVLQDLPTSSLELGQCILLGIAVASNIGGMPTPLSSPQNTVADGLINVIEGATPMDFFMWLKVTIPQIAVMILVGYGFLMIMYRPGRFALQRIPPSKEQFDYKHYSVIATVVVYVALLAWPAVANNLGPGVVSFVPLTIFYGSGLLSKEDFVNLPWDVVYLVAAGNALGAAVKSCQLLDIVAARLQKQFTSGAGDTLFMSFAGFGLFLAVVANMVSHTVSALIVLPVVSEVGRGLAMPKTLIVGSVMACSGAMAFRISSFPNMAATSLQTSSNQNFLTSKDLLRVGVPMTAVVYAVVVLIGYPWMKFLELDPPTAT